MLMEFGMQTMAPNTKTNQYDGQLRSTLIAPYNADLRKSATT